MAGRVLLAYAPSHPQLPSHLEASKSPVQSRDNQLPCEAERARCPPLSRPPEPLPPLLIGICRRC
jgi:hypothetical protein